MTDTEIVQGSPEWHQLRCGKVTASRVADVVAQNRAKTSWGKSRDTYMGELIAERLSGIPAESYTNAVMERGKEVEADARAAYEFFRDTPIVQVGFVAHPILKQAGASPDGLVGDDGLVEFKCPNTATHIDTVIRKKIDGRYLTQMQWQMACTERQWCDFVSYDPRLPAGLRMHAQRVKRDDERIAELTTMVEQFLRDMDAKIEQLQSSMELENV